MTIIDYSKLDRDTIEFLIDEIKKQRPKNKTSLVRYGMDRAIHIMNDYWLESLESNSKKRLDECKDIIHKKQTY